MKTVNSVIKINSSRINSLNKAVVTSLEQTAEALHTEVVQAQVVPRDTGTLQNEKMFVDTSQSKQGKVSLVHEGPYSRRLYYHPEYNFRTDENPNAQGEWFKDWEKGGKHHDFFSKAFAEFYKRNGGL